MSPLEIKHLHVSVKAEESKEERVMNRYFVKEFAKKIQENRRKGLFII